VIVMPVFRSTVSINGWHLDTDGVFGFLNYRKRTG
jgi:hypothetical protein